MNDNKEALKSEPELTAVNVTQQELTPELLEERRKETDARFAELMKEKSEKFSITPVFADVDMTEIVGYQVHIFAKDREAVVKTVERLEKMDKFDTMMALSFQSGMLDGIKTLRREIAKLGPMYSKACNIADKITLLIRAQTFKATS